MDSMTENGVGDPTLTRGPTGTGTTLWIGIFMVHCLELD